MKPKQKYVILRIKGSKKKKSDVLRKFTALEDTSKSDHDHIALEVEVDDLDIKRISTVQRDKTILSFAPSMPMKLVKPINYAEVANTDTPDAAWGIKAVNAHLSPYTGNGVKIAVLDTGIDQNHEAFKGIPMLLKNFTDDVELDVNGHGTHCAGTIFGSDVNNIRIGIVKKPKQVIIGKVLGKNGGNSEIIISAINWALEEGANIISLSLGIDFPGYVKYLTDKMRMPLESATSLALEGYRENLGLYDTLAHYIKERGKFINPCLLVAASGNESLRPDYVISTAPPAVSKGILSVGATDKNNNVAQFSNIKPDLCGPGVDILSAKTGGGLSSLNGTSMATPHITGVAALWMEKLQTQNRLTIDSLRANLIGNSKHSGLQKYNMEDYGAGLVQAPQ